MIHIQLHKRHTEGGDGNVMWQSTQHRMWVSSVTASCSVENTNKGPSDDSASSAAEYLRGPSLVELLSSTTAVPGLQGGVHRGEGREREEREVEGREGRGERKGEERVREEREGDAREGEEREEDERKGEERGGEGGEKREGREERVKSRGKGEEGRDVGT